MALHEKLSLYLAKYSHMGSEVLWKTVFT